MKRTGFVAGMTACLFLLGGSLSGAVTNVGNGRVFTGTSGDVFRVPSASTQCVVSAEGGAPNVICSHVGAHRYEVSFYRDNILVFRGPDKAVWSARGKP